MKTYFRFGSLIGLMSLIALTLFPAGVLAVDYGGLGGKPAHPVTSDPRTQSWFILKADPGKTLKDELLVVNNSALTKEVVVYAADSMAASGGGFALKQEQEVMSQLGSWITLRQRTFTLKSGEQKIVPFEVAVPASAAPGEYTGGILVQEKAVPLQASNGMTLAVRMGVRVYLTVAGEIVKRLVFDPITTNVKDRELEVVVPIRNVGNASADLTDGELTIKAHETGEVLATFPMKGFQVLQTAPFLRVGSWVAPDLGGSYDVYAWVAYTDSAAQTVRLDASIVNVTVPPRDARLASTGTSTAIAPTSVQAVAPEMSASTAELKFFVKVTLLVVAILGLLIGGVIGLMCGWRLRQPVHETAGRMVFVKPKLVGVPKKPRVKKQV